MALQTGFQISGIRCSCSFDAVFPALQSFWQEAKYIVVQSLDEIKTDFQSLGYDQVASNRGVAYPQQIHFFY